MNWGPYFQLNIRKYEKRWHYNQNLIHAPMRETCFLLGEKHGKIFKILIKKWLLITSLSIKKLIYRLLK